MKRALDTLFALVLLVVLVPLIVLLAAAIKLDSRGPLVYRSRRVGLGGREFFMLKFRKMRDKAEGSALTSANDERFTRIGSFLARTKLDEIPQLLNVIRGEMSLVGPRPEDPTFVQMHPEHFAVILNVRPGITGLSQLAYASEGQVLEGEQPVERYVRAVLPQKIGLDKLYVASRSTTMDLRILFWTLIRVLFRSEVAVNRVNGVLTFRRRPVGRVPQIQEQEGA